MDFRFHCIPDRFELPMPTGWFAVMTVPSLHPLLFISCFKCFLLVLYALCFSLHKYSEGWPIRSQTITPWRCWILSLCPSTVGMEGRAHGKTKLRASWFGSLRQLPPPPSLGLSFHFFPFLSFFFSPRSLGLSPTLSASERKH